jgi:hypothetical protein
MNVSVTVSVCAVEQQQQQQQQQQQHRVDGCSSRARVRRFRQQPQQS